MEDLTQFKTWLIADRHHATAIYAYWVGNFFKVFAEFNQQNYDQYVLMLVGRKLKNSTKNMHIKALNSYIKFLGSTVLPKKLFKEDSSRVTDYISKDQFYELLQLIDGDLFRDADKVKLILEFDYMAGLRLSENFTLQRKDFDLQNGMVKVLGKGNKVRVVPLPQFIVDKLKDFFAKNTEGVNAFNLNKTTVKNIYVKLAHSGIDVGKHLHSHLMRHSAAMYWKQEKNCTTRDLQQLLGHSDIKTTCRYEYADLKTINDKIKGGT